MKDWVSEVFSAKIRNILRHKTKKGKKYFDRSFDHQRRDDDIGYVIIGVIQHFNERIKPFIEDVIIYHFRVFSCGMEGGKCRLLESK